jgi:hypothetical protein
VAHSAARPDHDWYLELPDEISPVHAYGVGVGVAAPPRMECILVSLSILAKASRESIIVRKVGKQNPPDRWGWLLVLDLIDRAKESAKMPHF